MSGNKEVAEFSNFKIPKQFFDKFFEFTGSQDEASRGFVVAYVNQDGYPLVYSRAATPIVNMGLMKALEEYIDSDNNENIVDSRTEM